MCGILSIINKNRRAMSTATIKEMTDSIRHRGPDDEGFVSFLGDEVNLYYGNGSPKTLASSSLNYAPKKDILEEKYLNFDILLGHRRLSIVGLSDTGHQPMSDESGRYYISYNGEIYNYKELRKELESLGYKFFSDTDTEVLLKAYIEWGGVKLFTKLNGMWAFVIYDSKTKDIFVSRDRFGVKPLYYYEDNNYLIFCSEIKSLKPLGVLEENTIVSNAFMVLDNDESLRETSFKRVFRFDCSTYLSFSYNNYHKDFKKYFELNIDNDLAYIPFCEKKAKEYSQEYYELLEDSVRLRIKADVPIGLSLSGGLDSCSIAYFINKILKESNVEDNFYTYSCVYENQPELKIIDESKNVNKIAKQFGFVSRKISPNIKNFIKIMNLDYNIYELLMAGFSEGMNNVLSMPKKDGVTVLLMGQGADELLAGYPPFWDYFLSSYSLYESYKLSKKNSLGIKNYLKGILFKYPNILLKRKKFIIKNSFKSLGIDLKGELLDYIEFRLAKIYQPFNNLNDILLDSVKTNLANLLMVDDKYAMYYSLEGRHPFLDYRLVKFLINLPIAYKMYNSHTKYLARLAMNKKINDDIVWNKKKLGYASPKFLWYTDKNIISFIEEKANTSMKTDKFFEKKLFLKLWREAFFE